MLDPLDRHSRDSTLFQFTTKRLRDFIDPNHLLIQIDEQFASRSSSNRLRNTTVGTTADLPFTRKYS